MKRLWLLLAALIPGGCQTTPGFTWSFSFTVPPTINSTNTLHPIATMPAMSYAVERQQGATEVQRQYLVPQPVDPMPPPAIRQRPPMQQLPMPTPNQCQPTGLNVASVE